MDSVRPSEEPQQDTQAPGPAAIRSGEWAHWPDVLDYRAATLSDTLVERLVWGPQAEPRWVGNHQVAGPGYIWFRFWLPDQRQIVEKYFDPQGRALGMQVDVCLPPQVTPQGCSAEDLVLDIWITADGRVTVRNEVAFDQAVARGVLSAQQAAQAEGHVRDLTAAIARGRFPPALVRNWQVDLERLKEAWPQ